MFDVSFSELMLIGVIALIVIGPERLPKVARTIGHLLGRAQRYVNDVKSDIQREMDLKEIGDIKGQMEEAARSVKESMADVQSTVSAPMDEAKKALQDAQNLVGSSTADEPAAAPEAAPAVPKTEARPAEAAPPEAAPAEPAPAAPEPAEQAPVAASNDKPA